MSVIDVLKTELWGISWKLCAAITIAGFLALLWKVIERKILSVIEQKANERKQKKLEEITESHKIHIERNEPTYEEWKAAQEAKKHSEI